MEILVDKKLASKVIQESLSFLVLIMDFKSQVDPSINGENAGDTLNIKSFYFADSTWNTHSLMKHIIMDLDYI